MADGPSCGGWGLQSWWQKWSQRIGESGPITDAWERVMRSSEDDRNGRGHQVLVWMIFPYWEEVSIWSLEKELGNVRVLLRIEGQARMQEGGEGVTEDEFVYMQTSRLALFSLMIVRVCTCACVHIKTFSGDGRTHPQVKPNSSLGSKSLLLNLIPRMPISKQWCRHPLRCWS